MSMQLYRTCGILFGSYITGINIYNRPNNNIMYFGLSFAKGIIYGIGFPLAILMIYNDKQKYHYMIYKKHFIPGSTYYIKQPP